MYIYFFVLFCFCFCLAIGNLSVSNSVAALQHGVWATLGFLRGIAASSGVAGCSLCSLEWIHLMMDIVESASPRFSGRGGTRGNFSLLQQVCRGANYVRM